MSERYALYFAPARDSALWERATAWLGRDAVTGEPVDADIPGLAGADRATATAFPRRYGFHATLKAPMRLLPDSDRAALETALVRFSERRQVHVGPFRIGELGSFLAFVPEAAVPTLDALASDCVTGFDRFRAPLTPDERARYVRDGLSERQTALLERYGYPYVLEEFRFHMTLTGPLPPEERARVAAAAADWFAPVLAAPLVVDRICLFHEPESGAPFRRLADFELTPEEPS